MLFWLQDLLLPAAAAFEVSPTAADAIVAARRNCKYIFFFFKVDVTTHLD
jgi:hypothetical protein